MEAKRPFIRTPSAGRPELQNIRAIVELERETRRELTLVQRTTDAVTAFASRPTFIIGHLIFFAAWIGFNIWSANPFDRFPYSLLTLCVSLEAIVLTGFILMTQDRMTQAADRRANLDLQVNLLAERETTAMLKILTRIAARVGADISDCDPRLEQLTQRTDVQVLAEELTEQMADKNS